MTNALGLHKCRLLQKHEQEALALEQLAEHLLASQWPAWGMVATFYSALHWVDAYLALHHLHPSKHRERQGLVANETNLRNIWVNYRRLRTRSDDVRYRLSKVAVPQVRQAIDQDLQAIKTFVSSLLPRP